VMRRSDVITLHAPVADRPIVDRAAIETMEHAAFLINTARAGLVDESDVLAGLESGRISGYATDVFRTEPPEINDLLKHPRVVMTPHAGGFTEESVTRATKSAVDNILKHF
jgi:D-3-phosphoglycerate dehydrogenase